MNIFYYSVHHILEYDEVSMLKALGHNVFRIGTRNRTTSTANWRPEIANSPGEEELYDIYEALGGRYGSATNEDELLPSTFFEHFSVAVIMHSADFIVAHWEKLRRCRVVWRTIGQAVDAYEDMLRPYSEQGLKVVRYSMMELAVPHSIGQDAIIRFGKNSDELAGWSGGNGKLLTFCNTFQQRYPDEANDYRRIAERISCQLGGAHNEGFDESIGVVTPEEQKRLYRGASAYLYCSGLDIPYTLNFIEAWMIGIPMIVYAPETRRGRYYEIDRLIESGISGFVCRNTEEVVECSRRLLSNGDLSRRISVRGREAAIALFGLERISMQWKNLLSYC